jgi:hypothetical protein
LYLAGRCGGLLPGLAGFALQAPGQLACLILRPCLYVCLGGQLFHGLTELFAGPLDLLRQLLRVIRRRSGGGGADLLTRDSGGDGRFPRPGFGRAVRPDIIFR